MFQFMLVVGLVLAYYGYAVTKNPRIWGDQGRDAIKEKTGTAMSAIMDSSPCMPAF